MSTATKKRSITELVSASSPVTSRRYSESDMTPEELEDRKEYYKMLKKKREEADEGEEQYEEKKHTKKKSKHAIMNKDSFLHYLLFFIILAIIIYLVFYFFRFPFVQNKDLSGALTGEINQGKAIGWAIVISLIVVALVYLLVVPKNKY